jgi:hypothetical protein
MKQAGFSQQQIESLTAAYARLPKDVATQVTDPGALQTIADLTEVRNKVEGVPPGKSITIKAPSAEAIQDLKAIGFSVQENTKDKTVKITVPTNDAYDGSTEIQKMINGIRGRKVLVEIGTTGDIRGSAGGRMFAEADGGIMRFAQGGVTRFASGSERHIAQIAPAGSWRVWGEPETGGEGYIPLAASKRARSTDILRQIAGGFGYQLTPTGRDLTPVRHFAGPPAAGPGPGGDGRATTVNLYGASQSFGEQMADVVRHLEFVT